MRKTALIIGIMGLGLLIAILLKDPKSRLQEYTQAQIARIFNLSPVTIMRIINKKPKGWATKWHKRSNYKQE